MLTRGLWVSLGSRGHTSRALWLSYDVGPSLTSERTLPPYDLYNIKPTSKVATYQDDNLKVETSFKWWGPHFLRMSPASVFKLPILAEYCDSDDLLLRYPYLVGGGDFTQSFARLTPPGKSTKGCHYPLYNLIPRAHYSRVLPSIPTKRISPWSYTMRDNEEKAPQK